MSDLVDDLEEKSCVSIEESQSLSSIEESQSLSLSSLCVKETGAYSPFIGYLAQSIRQSDAERGLHNGKGDGDTPDSP